MSGVIIGVMSLIMSVFFGVRRRLEGTDTRPAEVVNHKRALDLSVAAWVRERDKTHAVAVALHNKRRTHQTRELAPFAMIVSRH